MEHLSSSDDEEMGEEELTGLAAKSKFALNAVNLCPHHRFNSSLQSKLRLN